jgi:hypothetical protein
LLRDAVRLALGWIHERRPLGFEHLHRWKGLHRLRQKPVHHLPAGCVHPRRLVAITQLTMRRSSSVKRPLPNSDGKIAAHLCVWVVSVGYEIQTGQSINKPTAARYGGFSK